ncbi:MAG: hypothetical protein Q9216_000683 [Gyalolechia sp. 2 TL-2023]
MPKTIFPPTPAPSMDLVGKDGGPQPSPNDKASFALPPPAIAPAPTCEAQTERSERLQAWTGFEYSLPPPPTRTRKIIQMTPKMDPKGDIADASTEKPPAKMRRTATRKTTVKRQPSSTSQAGKRIARKTAHSVIERRRRSKMNEEFGVLKDMIPACSNQEMHKLAILQASIEYLRYLERCVKDLKAATGANSNAIIQKSPPAFQQFLKLGRGPLRDGDDDDDDDEDSDVGMMEPSNLPSLLTDYQARISASTSPHSTATSPVLDTFRYQKATSYTSPFSVLPSPSIGSQPSVGRRDLRPSTHSACTSPNLMPTLSKKADEEATEALLMLNKDRRSTNASSNSSHGRSMSVKDLLSS